MKRTSITKECPHCLNYAVKIVSSNTDKKGNTIRRKACTVCNKRWYTLQLAEKIIPDGDVKWRNSGTEPFLLSQEAV
tara:strand:- start:487 stop:717 length:231 start_codon:yes stop_codon:yes gene_type:complete